MISISYAITVKDEIKEIQELVGFLLTEIGTSDEIVIVQDSTCNDEKVSSYLSEVSNTDTRVKVHQFQFAGNFSDLKNFLTSKCSKSWIFNIDADEKPNKYLIKNLPVILYENSTIDIMWVPRINIVNGITPEHIAKWGWTINDKGWINWGSDAQGRIYKKTDNIKWVNPVHERLDGDKLVISKFPDVEELSLYHIKDIARQERQNAYYETIGVSGE